MIAASRGRQLGHERLHGKRVRHVGHRPEPADTGMRDGFRVLDAQVGNVVRHVDQPHALLERRLVLGIRPKQGDDARRCAAVQPGHRLAPSVQSCLQVLHRHRVEIVVVDVVLARPGNLDRLASELLRQQRGFDREVRFGLAAETAAQKRHVDRDVFR